MMRIVSIGKAGSEGAGNRQQATENREKRKEKREKANGI
jgi:hypothetical protein